MTNKAEALMYERHPLLKDIYVVGGAKNKYYIYSKSDKKFIAWPEADLFGELDAAYGDKVNRNTIKAFLRRYRRVDEAISVGGHQPGPITYNGGRYLVLEGPNPVQPAPGEFPAIRKFVQGLLEGEDLAFFEYWAKNTVEMSLGISSKKAQALILAGPANCGKTQLQDKIITPLIGGRCADPTLFFSGYSFNADLVRAEHWKMDDPSGDLSTKARKYLGDRLKQAVVGEGFNAHGKNKDAFMVPARPRITVSINDTPERLQIFPDPSAPDIADKLMILECRRTEHPEFMEAGGFEDFMHQVQQELPAFAHYLLNHVEIPEELKHDRSGVTHYHNPRISNLIQAGEGQNSIIEILESLKTRKDFPVEKYTGSAREIANYLVSSVDRDKSRLDYNTLQGLFKHTRQIGRYLTHVAKLRPDLLVAEKKYATGPSEYTLYP